MLIILGGLPGSGKTTLARGLAARIGAVHVKVDTIEQAIRNSGIGDVGPAGYVVAYAVAADNLAAGRVVVADSVNAIEISRKAWRAVATRNGVRAIQVEVTCSDPREHRFRVETRETDVEGLIKPSWQAVTNRTWEDWDDSTVVIDTAGKNVSEVVEEVLMALQDHFPGRF
jgi:predicted kinase